MDGITWDSLESAGLLGLLERPDTLACVDPTRRLPDAVEREILEGLKRRDPDALRALYREYADLIRRLVLAPRVPDREVVLDLLHETFLTAATKGPEFRWQGVGFFPWLRGIARMKLRTRLRQRAREGARRVPLEDALPWLAAPGRTEDRLERAEHVAEIRRNLAEAMDALKERDRRVVELRLIQRRSREESATELGVNVPHLDVLFYRALRRLRETYRSATGQREGGGHG